MKPIFEFVFLFAITSASFLLISSVPRFVRSYLHARGITSEWAIFTLVTICGFFAFTVPLIFLHSFREITSVNFEYPAAFGLGFLVSLIFMIWIHNQGRSD